MMRLDSAGNVLWDERLAEAADGYAAAIVRHPLGGFLVAGAQGGATFIRIDDDGRPVWQRSYPGAARTMALVPLADGFVAAGQASGGWLARIDADARPIWEKRVAAAGMFSRGSVAVTRDGGILAVAGLGSSSGWTDAWLGKFDASGSLLWQRRLPGLSGMAQGPAVHEAANGDIVLTTTDDGVLALRLDSAGGMRWSVRVGAGGDRRGGYAIDGPDGGLVVAAMESGYATEPENLWLFGLTASGAMLWQKSIPNSSLEEATALIRTRDGAAMALSGGCCCSSVAKLRLDGSFDGTCEALVDTPATAVPAGFTSEEAAVVVEDTTHGIMDVVPTPEPAASTVENVCE
jgi:outer membrane protein assembly factor BamB